MGYEVIPPSPGVDEAGARRIKEAEAEIVRRIFRDYAAGKSPRHIARALNTEAVQARVAGPGPDRGAGTLNDTLYIGRLSWDRCSYVKDPRTGRHVARVNRRKRWKEVALPELLILSDGLWEAVRRRQAALRLAVTRDEGTTSNPKG